MPSQEVGFTSFLSGGFNAVAKYNKSTGLVKVVI